MGVLFLVTGSFEIFSSLPSLFIFTTHPSLAVTMWPRFFSATAEVLRVPLDTARSKTRLVKYELLFFAGAAAFFPTDFAIPKFSDFFLPRTDG